jgi:hypothetical protein
LRDLIEANRFGCGLQETTLGETDGASRRAHPKEVGGSSQYPQRSVALERRDDFAASVRGATQRDVIVAGPRPASQEVEIDRGATRLTLRFVNERVGIDGTFPTQIDAEVEVRRRGASVSRATDGANHVSGVHPRSFDHFLSLKVGEVEIQGSLLVAKPHHAAT